MESLHKSLIDQYKESFTLKSSNLTIIEDPERAGFSWENPVTGHRKFAVEDMYEFIIENYGLNQETIDKCIYFARKKGHAYIDLYAYKINTLTRRRFQQLQNTLKL